jgi:hypothetical protein
MTKMIKYMVVHKNPEITWDKVEENWSKLADIESATWVRTYFNKKMGVRYCLWLAPSEDVLKSIFSELNISFESTIEVEETVPDLWGKKWEEHLKAEEKASTKGF